MIKGQWLIKSRIKLWKKLSFNLRWNFRDAKRNKLRSIMTIFGVLACTTILITSFAAQNSVLDVKVWEYEDITHYNTKLMLSDSITNAQIDNILNNTNGELIEESPVEIRKNDEKYNGMLTVLDNSKLITPTNGDKGKIQMPTDGVAVSSKVSDYFGVEKGDTISWHLQGSNVVVTSNITQVYTTPVSQGIIISQEEFNKTDYNFTPTSIITTDVVHDNYTGVKTTVLTSDLVSSWDYMMSSMMRSVYILIFFAAALSVVVLYNLGLLSFTEIIRDIATLKVLGFDSKSLRRLLLTQNLFFSVIGFILGLPLGKLIIDYMLSTAGADYVFSTSISSLDIILTLVITFGVSLIVNLSFSKRIEDVDMVESLKDIE